MSCKFVKHWFWSRMFLFFSFSWLNVYLQGIFIAFIFLPVSWTLMNIMSHNIWELYSGNRHIFSMQSIGKPYVINNCLVLLQTLVKWITKDYSFCQHHLVLVATEFDKGAMLVYVQYNTPSSHVLYINMNFIQNHVKVSPLQIFQVPKWYNTSLQRTILKSIQNKHFQLSGVL